MIVLGLLPGCALMTGRYESHAVRLEHATGRQVCDALEQVFGPTDYRCGMDRSVRDPDLPPNVGVDASDAPMIVVWVEGGGGDDLERALKIVRAVDDAASDEWGRRIGSDGGSDGGSIRTILPAQTDLPDGAATLVLLHADARDVARLLNDLVEKGYWKARSRSCVLYAPPEVIEVPRPSFLAWDARTLVVLEASRDEAYLPQVRELVERVDVPSDGE
ncbi:MAG: hypothetical protein NTY35_12825 [Planctomycetota bacterium]|nr:hypothetical protein [Planctomycetota bacterium]